MAKKALRPLHRGEPESMLRKASTSRDRALLVLLWRGGLRANEACMTRCQDFEFSSDGSSRIHIVFAKGGRQRWGGFGPKYTKILKTHMGRRKTGWFLSTSSGEHIIRPQVYRTIRLLGMRAHVQGHFHPHAMRHCYARDLHDEGYSVLEIQKALGHKNLNTTQVYLEGLGVEAIVNKLTLRE